MTASPPIPPERATVPAPRRRRRLWRWLVAALLLLVLLVLAAPLLLNLGFVRRQVAKDLGASLGAPVAIGELGFSWVRGFRVGQVVVGDFLTLAELEGDVALGKLLTGQVDVRVLARGVRVTVVRRADGTTNVPRPAQDQGSRSDGSGEDSGDGAFDGLRLDLQLADAEVTVRDERTKQSEVLRIERFDVRKEPAADLHLELAASLPAATGAAARVALRADVDPALRRPASGRLEVAQLDLARLRPLLAAFAGEDALRELAGVVHGSVDAQFAAQRQSLDGELRVERPRLRGAWTGDALLAGDLWVLQPTLRVQAEPGRAPVVDAGSFAADLGFARLRGAGSEEANAAAGGPALGVRLDVDLRQLAALGGAVPTALANGPDALRGLLAVRVPQDGRLDAAAWARAGGGTLRLEAATGAKGHGALEVRALPAAGADELTVAFQGLDLAPWRGVVEELAARGPLAELGGVVDGSVRVQVGGSAAARTFATEGTVRVAGLRARGPAVAGLELALGDVALEPHVRARTEAGRVAALDLERLRAESAVLRLRGLPAAEAFATGGDGAAAVAFELDVHGLARLGGPLPAALAQAPSPLAGSLAVAPAPAEWRATLALAPPPGGGELAVRGSLGRDPGAAAIAAELRARAVALEPWLPLLAASASQAQVTALAGRFDGEWRFERTAARAIASSGELTLAGVRLAGPALGPEPLVLERVVLRPDFRAQALDGAWAGVDVSQVSCQLGFATLEGLPVAEARALAGDDALGVRLRADLDRLAPLLAAFTGRAFQCSGGKLDGTLTLRLERGLLVPADLGARVADAARAQFALAAARLDVAGHRLANVQASAALQDRELVCTLADGATLDGGSLRAAAKVTFPAGGGDPRAELRASVRDADLDAAAVPWLRFPLPLLAGLEPDATLDFRTRATLEFEVAGTVRSATGLTPAERARDLQGKGALELRGGAFTPAPALKELLALARTGGQLRFDRVAGDVALERGALRTDKLRFEEGSHGMVLRGSTTLAGELDYSLDVTELLRGHRDGDKVLAALGGKAPEVRLRGDVRAPSLAMFDVEALLRQAAQGALQGGLKDALDKLLRRRERK